MHVVLTPSPSAVHRYRVILPGKLTVDFGSTKVWDYTSHRDPTMMRAQLLKRGAVIPAKLLEEQDHREIHRGMLQVEDSHLEDWHDVHQRFFWERWVLYSYSSVDNAKLYCTMQKGLLFMPTADDFFYV